MKKKQRISIILALLIGGVGLANFLLTDLFSRGRESFPFGLGNITDLQIDSQNRPWIKASNSGRLGIWYLENSTWHAIELPEMVDTDQPWKFAIDSLGEIWLVAHEGLYVFDGIKWVLHPSPDDLLRGNFRFIVDTDGSAWLGYWGEERNGLLMFNGQTWHQLLSDINVTEVSARPDGQLWVGTDNGDIIRFDHDSIAQTFSIDDYNRTNQNFGARSIWDIEFDDQGNAWMVSDVRIYRFDAETWRIYTTPDDFLSMSDIAVDRQGHIWQAFLNQLVQFDGGHWNWVFDERGDYASGSSVAVDGMGRIWVGDGDEVRSIDPETISFPSIDLVRWQRFFSAGGLLFLEFSLLLVLVSVWLNSIRPALLTVGFGLLFLFVANYLLFPDHWGVTGKLSSAWPIIEPGLLVLAGGVLGTLVSLWLRVKTKFPANDLRLTVAGSGIGFVIGLILVYFFLAGTPLT